VAADNAAPVTVFAPAKVNLYLHVTGRRADGYHLVDSLVAFADIGDRITAEPAAQLSLALSGPEAETLATAIDDNLVLRAARLLADRTGASAGAATEAAAAWPE
jgi:4-diphosphocytidyl-2-C-methyl-D-erythritol kinase